MPPLSEWESFYVILGSSAAALTGLMFVVVALGAEARSLSNSLALRAFGTPTIVHFCAVLLLAALLTTPHQSPASLHVCLLVAAGLGLVYTCWAVAHARVQQAYAPVLEDWIWHLVLPLLAYLGLFSAACLFRREPEAALYVVGASALLLLFDGIHNAWDSAVWLAAKRGSLAEKED